MDDVISTKWRMEVHRRRIVRVPIFVEIELKNCKLSKRHTIEWCQDLRQRKVKRRKMKKKTKQKSYSNRRTNQMSNSEIHLRMNDFDVFCRFTDNFSSSETIESRIPFVSRNNFFVRSIFRFFFFSLSLALKGSKKLICIIFYSLKFMESTISHNIWLIATVIILSLHHIGQCVLARFEFIAIGLRQTVNARIHTQKPNEQNLLRIRFWPFSFDPFEPSFV